MVYTAAVIGTGPDPTDPGREGYAMGYRHGRAYRNTDACELVACADIVPENGQAFAREFGLPDTDAYEDYAAMLSEVRPDIVSVCVPPAVHAEVVLGCAESGEPLAVHCEKPMADTWGDCQEMVRACERAGIQLTINHQRRFGAPFREAKRLLDAGTIGDLRTIDVAEGTLFDGGTHLVDLCQYFTADSPVEWVIAQVDYREENVWFGTRNATQAIAQWRYEDGTLGMARTGESKPEGECYLRLVGTNGTAEIGVENGPSLRVRHGDSTWRTVDTNGETIHGRASPGYLGAAVRRLKDRLPAVSPEDLNDSLFIRRAIADVVGALETGEEPELSGRKALRATEILFASWESARRGGRIDLPLGIEDNPLAAMIDAGRLGPEGSAEGTPDGVDTDGDSSGPATDTSQAAVDGGDRDRPDR
jgi:predicted dehydrogenase